ncbi:MAG: right-handed parallel beta-helix repeat-containing protein, partial [Thermoplasmata archaeon]|nr:right-handed parallel beta-helix repeat-containing protein [Thermoplasmata archaeon]
MRKLTTLGIVFVLIAVIFAAIPVNVSAEGTITVPDEYPTIQQAIDAANPGDTVYVRAGTYYERLIINKPLTLQGEDRDTTIIDGNAIGNVITLSADYITITGFTIMNSAWMNTWYAGSVIYGSDTSYHKITDNKVTQNSQGIYLQYYSDYNIITNNIVYNVKDTGIILGYGCDNNLINSNEVFECSSNMGIFLAGADNNEISDNYLTKNAEAITLTRSSYNSVTNNMLVDNTWFGITMMDESIYNDISDNSVLNSYYAFQMSGWDPWEGPNNNLVTQNTFENGQYGIYINGAYQNLIYHNNIVNFVKPAIDFGGW